MSSFSVADLGEGRFATLLTAPARGWGDRWAPLRTAVACTVAWLVASAVSGNTSPLFAPIVALLTLQASVYSSVALATQRILGSVLGVVLATLYVNLVGLTWWSLALAVAVAVFIGRQLPLGYSGQVQIPLAVVLVVVVGPVNHGIGLWRGFDVVVGGVVGVTVALLWPEQPRYTPAFEAQRSWRDALSKQLSDVAIELRRPPQLLRDDERHDFVQGSRQLHGYAARGRQRVEEAEESLYFNLRAGRVREQTGALVGQQRWLVRLTLHIRSLSYAVDRLYDRAVPPMLDRVALARLLDGLATQIPHAPVPADDLAAQRLQATIATLVSEVATSPGATVRALDSVGILARLEQLRDDLVDHVDEDPDSDR
jgi:uncharacterized membrane protein YccC